LGKNFDGFGVGASGGGRERRDLTNARGEEEKRRHYGASKKAQKKTLFFLKKRKLYRKHCRNLRKKAKAQKRNPEERKNSQRRAQKKKKKRVSKTARKCARKNIKLMRQNEKAATEKKELEEIGSSSKSRKGRFISEMNRIPANCKNESGVEKGKSHLGEISFVRIRDIGNKTPMAKTFLAKGKPLDVNYRTWETLQKSRLHAARIAEGGEGGKGVGVCIRRGKVEKTSWAGKIISEG